MIRDYTADLTTDLHFMRREDCARWYALALGPNATADWPRVNVAIIENWSRTGLAWIKQRAWQLRDLGEVRP